jgi:hypothetical protein
VDIVLLYFAKAFDKTPHQRLVHKLNYDIRGNTILWIRDFLQNRSQPVVLESHMLSTASVLSGVYFSSTFIYKRPIPEKTTSDARLFADDCLLYKPITCEADNISLQKDLVSLIKWETEWQMAFHPEKCVVIQVTRVGHRYSVLIPYRGLGLKIPVKYRFMKWLRYQRVISLETQVGITSQRNKWANTDPRIYRRWDQVPRRSEHPLLTGRTRHEPHFKRRSH